MLERREHAALTPIAGRHGSIIGRREYAALYLSQATSKYLTIYPWRYIRKERAYSI